MQIPGGKQADNSKMGPNKTADQNQTMLQLYIWSKKAVCKETDCKFDQPLYLKTHI